MAKDLDSFLAKIIGAEIKDFDLFGIVFLVFPGEEDHFNILFFDFASGKIETLKVLGLAQQFDVIWVYLVDLLFVALEVEVGGELSDEIGAHNFEIVEKLLLILSTFDFAQFVLVSVPLLVVVLRNVHRLVYLFDRV